jgi:tetratricopeptide (TPR) repeat protein
MSSSKRRDSRSTKTTSGDSNQNTKKRSVRPLILLSLLLLLVLGLTVQRLFFSVEPSSEASLEDGRAFLKQAFAGRNAAQTHTAAAQAEASLEQYLKTGGDREPEARLLLVSSLAIQELSGGGQSEAVSERVTNLLANLDVEQCALDDVLDAISLLSQIGRLAEADRLVGAALESTEQRAKTLKHAIEIRYGLGRREEALRHCDELLELAPGDPYVWEKLARIYRDLARHELEAEAYQKLIELAPQYASDFRHRLLLKQIELGKITASRSLFDQLQRESPDVLAKSPVTKAKLLQLEGDAAGARSILEQVLHINSENKDGLLLLGRIQFTEDDFTGAVTTLEQLIEIDPTDARAHYLLGQAYARNEQPKLAQERLSIHKRVSDVRDEIEQLQRVAEHSPRNVAVRRAVAELYRQIGAEDQAKYWDFAANEAAKLSD